MAYTDSILTPARDARNFILESLDYAATAGNQFNENFVGQQQIPERLSRTRLNDLNNRFGIEDRQNTWETDLERNRLESELGVRTNRYALDDFDAAREAERRQRDLQLQKAEQELEFFDEERINRRLALDNERLRLEGEIEKRTFDNQYDELIGAIEGYAFLPALERYTRLMDLADARKVHPNVKARINNDFLETNAREFRMFNVYVSLSKQIEDAINRGVDPNSAELQDLRKRANNLRVLGINQEVIAAAARQGLISMESAGYLLDNPATENAAQQAVNAPVAGGEQPSVPDSGLMTDTGQPIDRYVSPANGGMVDTGQPIDSYESPMEVQAPPAPAPVTQEQAPVPQTAQEATIQYEQPLVTSPMAYSNIVSIENNPSFPPQLRGLLFDRGYDASNINAKIDDLISYAEFAMSVDSDPEALDLIWQKIESVERFRQQNGW